MNHPQSAIRDPQPEDRQEHLSAAFHDTGPVIGGHPMRPLSLASYDVLLRTGNPLVSGAGEPAEGTPELNAALIGFVYAHCAPWREVVRASFDPQAFREEALVFCGELTPADFQAAFGEVERQGRMLEAAQVESAPVPGKKQGRPATSRG